LKYFVIDHQGKTYGPATLDDLNSWIQEGRIDPTMKVQDSESGETMPISRLPGINIQQNIPPRPLENVRYASSESFAQTRIATHIENHLAKAIISTLLCCLPLGIVAIVYSAQVDGHLRRGDYDEAKRCADSADTWANWSIGLGVAWAMFVICSMLSAVSATSGVR